MSDSTFMGIFDSIESINNFINNINTKTDIIKLYNLINLILTGLCFLLIIGLFFYIRKL